MNNTYKAREFIKEVQELSKQYDLPFFIVTDGASAINNNGCKAITHARKCHEEWEKEYGINSDHNWLYE